MTIEIHDYPAPGCGMGVTFNHVAWQMLQHPEHAYWVNIKKGSSPYLEPGRGPNPWDYYFVQSTPELPMGQLKDPQSLALSGHHDWTLAYQRAIHERVAKNFVLRPEIQDRVDAFRAKHFRGRVLGVHLRGTDKIGEYRPMPNIEIVEAVRGLCQHLKPHTVFLATDDADYYTLMKQFGAVSAPVARSKLSQHHFPPSSPYESGASALVDAWLLAACDWMAFTPSNFATIPLVMGSHQSIHRINRYCNITPFAPYVDRALGFK